VSDKGVITAGEKQRSAQSGAMVFAPAVVRGVNCLERMTVLGIQESH